MLGGGMKKICKRLSSKKIELGQMRALEIFARDGSWQTAAYADKVASLVAWEINSIFENDLRNNLPNAKIKITDSIKELDNQQNFSKFDLIVIDNGQNCYGNEREYCEHFDVIPKIAKLLDHKGVLIFNINKKPFNFTNYPDWNKRRLEFYNKKNTAELDLDWLLEFYNDLFFKFGYKTNFSFSVSREDFEHADYLHYLIFHLEKINNENN